MTSFARAGACILFTLSLAACGSPGAPVAQAGRPLPFQAWSQAKPSPLASVSARQALRFEASEALRRFGQLNRDWEAAWTAKGRDRVEAELLKVAVSGLEGAHAKSASGPEMAKIHALCGQALARGKELQRALEATEALARKRELVQELQILLTGALHEVVYGD